MARRQLRIAVEGCAHGDLERIYASLAEAEARAGAKVDLLICCGDFQEGKKNQIQNKDFYLVPEGRLLHALYPFYLIIFMIITMIIMERMCYNRFCRPK